MRLSKLAFLAALCTGTVIGAGVSDSNAWGQSPADDSYGFESVGSGVSQVSHCNCGSPDGACSGGCSSGDCGMPMEIYDSGCGDGGCGDGSLFDQGILNDSSCLGDPYKLLGEACGISMGGWAQLGYHNKNLSSFNGRKDEFQLHQAWVYAEKAIDTSGGFDIGGRVDYLYGTDGPDTQAFGVDTGSWDTGWDNGPDYGHALPQAYLEAGYGDWSVKVGHFFTAIGYEVVPATGNFFYSHAYTMYNSEPFTHTGAMITYSMSEDVDVFGGYVMGWDSGFDDNGDSVMGGANVQLTDDINVTSTLIGGRFNDRAGRAERGFMSSTVAQVQLTPKLSYVFQTDLLETEDAAGNTDRETFDINQYLFRTINDYVQLGSRFEWWQVQADSSGYGLPTGAIGDYDVYALTLGLNVQPHANVMIRPEIRWDWVDGNKNRLAAADFGLLEGNSNDQTTFGIDTIFTY
ncbi:MAG: porin [Rubripirellula sp.]